MQSVLPIFLLVTLGSLAGLSGGLLLLSKISWASFLSRYSIAFAAGVMLAVTFLDLLPEAIQGAGVDIVLQVILVVIVITFWFEKFFLQVHHHQEQQISLKSSISLVVAGDTIHNFFDGVGIAAAYLLDQNLGILVALATFLHEVPHEIGDFGLMLAAGWKKAKIITVNLISALSSYLGAAAVVLFSAQVYSRLNFLLAMAGGLLLYISVADLLPQVRGRQKDSWKQPLLVLGGAGIIWILKITL